jgi:hypothetical protein
MSSLLVFLFSCDFQDEEIVCEVGSYQLSENKLEEFIILNDGNIDNTEDREKAIEEWVDIQLLKLELEEKAPEILNLNQLKVEKELAERNLFELENRYIKENLDSSITDSEIQSYYEKHRENYVRQSYIVRALYMKVADTLGDHGAIAESFMLKNDKHKEDVKKYATLYTTNFYFEEKKWIYFEDLIRDIPISESMKNELIVNRGDAIFKEGGFTHFINILDYRLKNISSPLEVEKKLIEKHILKRRINALREKARETIIENVRQKYKVNYR